MTIDSKLGFLRHKKQNSESALPVERTLQKQDSSSDFTPQDVSYSSVFGPFLKNLTTSRNPTKLPYPAQFYYPASSLQHQTTLQMNHIDLLLNANKQENPLDRFLCVLKYILSTTSLTKFPYKPFIAFVGETSHNYTQHSQGDASDTTYFVGEQLSRDPPTACYHINNPARGVTQEGVLELDAKVKQAHVRVKFNGKHKTTLVDPLGRWNEEYISDVPDLMIRLIRLHTELGGTVHLTCPTTGYSAEITFKDKPLFGGAKNMISGKITDGRNTLFSLDGAWDDVIFITNLLNNTRAEFMNRHTLPRQTLHRPAFSDLPSTSGDREWEHFIEALKERDFTKAMAIKEELGKVDAERQRQHLAESPAGFAPKYFIRDVNGQWTYKNTPFPATTSATAVASVEGSASM